MTNTTDTAPSTSMPKTTSPSSEAAPSHLEQPGVNVAFTDSANPNDPTTEEAMIARFPSPTEAEKVVDELVSEGVARERITILTDPTEKRDFMTRYIRRDNDRHTHSGTSSAFFALGGAFTLGLLAVVITTPFGMMATIIGAIAGGVLGALLGAVLGGLAMRPADDRSMEVVETLAHEGALLAIRHPSETTASVMSKAAKILCRHNASVIRLRPHLSLADLHPGDTRSNDIGDPLNRQPRT